MGGTLHSARLRNTSKTVNGRNNKTRHFKHRIQVDLDSDEEEQLPIRNMYPHESMTHYRSLKPHIDMLLEESKCEDRFSTCEENYEYRLEERQKKIINQLKKLNCINIVQKIDPDNTFERCCAGLLKHYKEFCELPDAEHLVLALDDDNDQNNENVLFYITNNHGLLALLEKALTPKRVSKQTQILEQKLQDLHKKFKCEICKEHTISKICKNCRFKFCETCYNKSMTKKCSICDAKSKSICNIYYA